MVKRVLLTVLVGPVVPVPVPQVVLDALTSITVTTPTTGPTVFELDFQLSNKSPLHTIFLLTSGGALPPIIRVILVVTMNGMPDVLVDGVITKQEIDPGEDGMATLRVMGEDLTRVMVYTPFDGLPYPAMPPEARVALILAKYAVFGVIPLIIPSVLIDIPIPIQRIPLHQGTDLAYIRCLAEEVGYSFYLIPGPAPGASFGYWGPLVKIGVPQPALNINMDAHTNVEKLSFSLDTEAKATPVLTIQEPFSKAPIPIPVPDLNPLAPPLGLLPLISKRFEPVLGVSSLSTPRALLRAWAQQAKTAGGVKASGSLNVLRYGRVLKARGLVGVRGAGPAFNGLYYVEKVTHSLKRGEYVQSFELNRGGLVSATPKVPV